MLKRKPLMIRKMTLIIAILISVTGVLSLAGCSEQKTADPSEETAKTEETSDEGEAASTVDSNGWLSHFDEISEIGNTYESVDGKYGLTESGSTDNFHVYHSSDGEYAFVFIGSGDDSGDIFSEYVVLSTDTCTRMTGSAGNLFGIDGHVSIADLEDELGCEMFTGSGNDLETGAFSGMNGVFTDKKSGDIYCIFIRDADPDKDITQDMTVDVSLAQKSEDVKVSTPAEASALAADVYKEAFDGKEISAEDIVCNEVRSDGFIMELYAEDSGDTVEWVVGFDGHVYGENYQQLR